MTTNANFPVTAGSIVVPYGHVIGNEKWRGSEVAQRLQGKHKQTARGKASHAKRSPLLPRNVENGWNTLHSVPDWSHVCGTDCQQAGRSRLFVMYPCDQLSFHCCRALEGGSRICCCGALGIGISTELP